MHAAPRASGDAVPTDAAESADRRARARRRARRLGITLGVLASLALVAFGASPWFWIGATGKPYYLQYSLRRGCVFALWFPRQSNGVRNGFGNPGYYASRVLRPGLDSWFDWRFGGTVNMFRIPLWPAALALGCGSVLAFRRARALKDPSRCARCGYDLAGLPVAICPECGPAPATPVATIAAIAPATSAPAQTPAP